MPKEKADVRIKPIYGLSPFDDPFGIAYYGSTRNKYENDRIEIYSPQSYGYGGYDPQGGWEFALEDTVTHEYTHMTHKRSFDKAGHLMSWVSEGIAEYVAGELWTSQIRSAVKAGNIIHIMDISSRVTKQDLIHLGLLDKDRSLAYGFFVSLVVFITRNYGGLDGFWKFARAFDEIQDLDKVTRRMFGISFEQFDREWHAFLTKD